MKARNQNEAQGWLRRIEYAFLLCGLALVVFWGGAQVESTISSRAALRKLTALDSVPSRSAVPTRSQTENAPWLAGDPDMSDEMTVQTHKPSATKDHDLPLAILRIPTIRLEVPVVDGTDRWALNHAVGRIAGTSRPGEQGNIGLAGHRDGLFRGLKDVRVGDTVEVESTTGTAIYIVDQISIVSPGDVDVLQTRSVPSVTLVTCYPFFFIGNAPKRYIVAASLIQGSHRETQATMPADELVRIDKEEQ